MYFAFFFFFFNIGLLSVLSALEALSVCARDKFNSSFEKYDFQIDYGSFKRYNSRIYLFLMKRHSNMFSKEKPRHNN